VSRQEWQPGDERYSSRWQKPEEVDQSECFVALVVILRMLVSLEEGKKIFRRAVTAK